MSQAKITLRPPPNVEFVQGYPGIPPAAPDRPQAAVKGTIELRLGSQGVKAKWVRIELRKVETLPGGGQTNTFYDFVGQSPVNIWQAQEEWGTLQTQDFPFFIRIPESIPPSIALEKSAGIKYELIATVCTKGKKGLLRRASSPTLSTLAHIIIDKHELHSTWPIYAQPESRHVVTDALTLTVDRAHTCYGPGDRISVMATLKSDNLSTVTLRAFEFMLKETIIFRAGPHVPGKKGAPQVKVATIGEQKVPVNVNLYGGTHHTVELACFIPQTHTTTTVNAARHIDIAYSINVKAVLSSGKPLLMDLPVTVSNWPRTVSLEAVRRIGTSPNLSLIPAGHIQSPGLPQHIQRPGSAGHGASQAPQSAYPNSRYPTPGFQTMPVAGKGPGPQPRPYSIAEKVGQNSGAINGPSRQPDHRYGGSDFVSTQHGEVRNGYIAGDPNSSMRSGVDEFGYQQSNGVLPQQPATFAGYSGIQSSTLSSNPQFNDSPGPSGASVRSTGTSGANRFTVVNMTGDLDDVDEERVGSSSTQTNAQAHVSTKYPSAEEEKRLLQKSIADAASRSVDSTSQASPAVRAPSTSPVPNSPVRTPWPTAEEEKQRLFNKARADAQRIQSTMGTSASSQVTSPVVAAQLDPGQGSSSGTAPQTKSSPWATAEEEKKRLFDQAQAAARHTQARAGNSPPPMAMPSGQPRSASSASGSMESSGPSHHIVRPAVAESLPTTSAGARLYSHAISSMGRSVSAQVISEPIASLEQRPPPASRSRLPTAEEEKAALRYYQAKRAVDRHQNVDAGTSEVLPTEDPISYDVLYPLGPSGVAGSSSHSPSGPTTPPANITPPFASQQQDRTRTPNQANGINSDSFLPVTEHVGSSTAQQNNDILSEKERLRRRYEVEDAAASVTQRVSANNPMPRSETAISGAPPTYGSSAPRSQPLPPGNARGVVPLTAAEEKARLRAQYEAEENTASGNAVAGFSNADSAHRPAPPARSSSMTTGSQPSKGLRGHPSISLSKVEGGMDEESFVPPPPPPLMPRPPAEYIQETQEEDARTQAEEHTFLKPPVEHPAAQVPWEQPASSTDFSLNFRPFSPLDLSLGLDTIDTRSYSPPQTPAPPPLPPKVPVLD